MLIQFSRRFSRRKEKIIISCFLTSYMHQVEFFLLIFFNIWPFIYWTLNKQSLETWTCVCCYCAYGLFLCFHSLWNISWKRQEIWGGSQTVWCRSQWVKNVVDICLDIELCQLKNGYSSPTSMGTPPLFSRHCNQLIISFAWEKAHLISIAENWTNKENSKYTVVFSISRLVTMSRNVVQILIKDSAFCLIQI